jgi:hypothetical protein
VYGDRSANLEQALGADRAPYSSPAVASAIEVMGCMVVQPIS